MRPRLFVPLCALCVACESSSAPPADASVDAARDATVDVATDVAVAAADVPRVTPHPGEPGGCNGLRINCARTYDRVAIAATHNAYSYAAGGPVRYSYPNQDLPVPAQLSAGVRGLGLRPCPYYGQDPDQVDRVYVTHNTSLRGLLGTEPLDDILRSIRAFLDANPREVVTLYLESAVTPAQVAAVFAQVGLDPYLYAHDARGGWPTLQSMIDRGQRLVVFNDSEDPARPAWMLHLWDHIVDTDYNVTDPTRFSCAFYRGRAPNAIYYLNQFVYRDLGSGILVPDVALARRANDRDAVLARVRQCLAETGRVASVVYVDWFAQGDVVGAVDAVNAWSAGLDAGP